MRRLVAILSFCMGISAHAQLPEAVPGARVRLSDTAHPARIDGTVIVSAVDSLVVATRSGDIYRFTPASLTSAELYRGHSASLGAKRGAFVGAVVSAAPALMFVGYAAASNGPNNLGANLAGAAVSVAAYAAVGALIGALIGADEWQTLRLGVRP